MGKVTISGDVELEMLIKTPNKNGKYAELIGDPKQNSGMQVEAKVPKRRRGGGKLTHSSCEKIGVEGEHARVAEFIRKGSGDESHDIFVLEADIYSIVKKDVKKEEDIDINIFTVQVGCTVCEAAVQVGGTVHETAVQIGGAAVHAGCFQDASYEALIENLLHPRPALIRNIHPIK
nr:B3 domain-containing protein At5g60130-like isoform X1 [Ipomoea batatas]